MNLFISDNFIDTVGQKVNIIQLIQQVAEDDDLLQLEIISELANMFDYTTNGMEEAINDGEFDDILLQDETLYVGGEVLKDLFESLYPGDHTAVINSLVNSIINASDTTLRLDHNCTPVVPAEREEVQQSIDFSNLAHVEVQPHDYGGTKAPSSLILGEARNVPLSADVPENHVVTGVLDDEMTVRPVEIRPFPAEEVQRSEVAVLNSEAVMGELKVNNRTIPVAVRTGKNGVLFDAVALYYAAYGLMLNHEYLTQILIENRLAINPDDIDLTRGTYMTAGALAVLHGRLCHIIEWEPLVMKVVTAYDLNPHLDFNFDLLGNRVG